MEPMFRPNFGLSKSVANIKTFSKVIWNARKRILRKVLLYRLIFLSVTRFWLTEQSFYFFGSLTVEAFFRGIDNQLNLWLIDKIMSVESWRWKKEKDHGSTSVFAISQYSDKSRLRRFHAKYCLRIEVNVGEGTPLYKGIWHTFKNVFFSIKI